MASIFYVFEVRDSGTLTSGLDPIWDSLMKLSDGSSVADPDTVAAITELGGGLYKIDYDPEGADGELAGVIDAGGSISSDADRFITIVLAQDSSRVLRLNATVASRAVPGSAMTLLANSVNAAALATDAVAEIAGAIPAAPTTSEVADAVWSEALSGYTTAGSAGKKLGDLPTSQSAFAVLGLRLEVSGQESDQNTLPRLMVHKGDNRDFAFWVVDGEGSHVPIPDSITPTLKDVEGESVGSAERVDLKSVVGYFMVRLEIPSSGTMPAVLSLLFDGGPGATWTWDVLLTVL